MKNIEDVVYIVTDDDSVEIVDSWDVSKENFDAVLDKIRKEYPKNAVLVNRSNRNLGREWAVHNFCYNLGLWKDHTKDVDLNYPLRWYVSVAYCVFGRIAMIFIP